MKRIILIMFAITFSLICILALFNYYLDSINGSRYYTFESELGDVFTVEVFRRGNLKGMYPNYLIYDGDESIGKKNGVVQYVDRDSEDCPLPDDPLSNISTVGKYGDYNFYKIFDTIFYYRRGVYMDSFSYQFDYYDYIDLKKPDCPKYLVYQLDATAALMKSHIFEYIFIFGESLAHEQDEDMKQLLQKYAAGDFTDEEKQINAASSITEADMTSFAQYLLEKYYAE